MRKFFLLISLLMFGSVGALADDLPAIGSLVGTRYVNQPGDETVLLHREPQAGSRVVSEIDHRAAVGLLRQYEGWVHVNVLGSHRMGWVREEFLSDARPEPTGEDAVEALRRNQVAEQRFNEFKTAWDQLTTVTHGSVSVMTTVYGIERPSDPMMKNDWCKFVFSERSEIQRGGEPFRSYRTRFVIDVAESFSFETEEISAEDAFFLSDENLIFALRLQWSVDEHVWRRPEYAQWFPADREYLSPGLSGVESLSDEKVNELIEVGTRYFEACRLISS